MLKKVTDEYQVKQYINKDNLLNNISQESIFQVIFGFKPEPFEYITSPFRDDSNAGCWFEYSIDNKLLFIDFASGIYNNGRLLSKIDCFAAVQIYYKLNTFIEALIYIKNNFTKDIVSNKNVVTIHKKLETEIIIETRCFNQKDKDYWQQYEITSQNLIDDKVFAVCNIAINNSKKGDMFFLVYDLCYAYTDFKNQRKKIHRPNQVDKKRFITNCNRNDIYGISSLTYCDNLLIITKSYKDYRVIKNQGYNVIAFQNEGMFPENDILLPICNMFDKIVIFFDNDTTGINASQHLCNYINNYFDDKCTSVHLPESLLDENIYDASDMIKYKKQKELIIFLEQNTL
jgi:hypothetical protein